MARLVLCVLALCATAAFAAPAEGLPPAADKYFKLFENINEPVTDPEIWEDLTSFGAIKDHLDKYENQTAANTYDTMLRNDWYLPRGAPFSFDEPAHAFEAMTLFNVLYSAKDFDTYYRTCAYLRNIINEGIFVYVTSASIVHRKDTQHFGLEPLYNVFPTFFATAETIAIADRIAVHGAKVLGFHDNMRILDGQILIYDNKTHWPYVNDKNFALTYFTNDLSLNAGYYLRNVILPYWLSSKGYDQVTQEQRGETWWFTLRTIVARYYMERLSNGLGEIPELSDVIEDGFNSGLVYANGVPFPSRPDNYRLEQPNLSSTVEKAREFERRIWDAIDKGYYINRQGEKVSLLSDDSLGVVANLIESNADSPNRYFYKDFIRLWKQVLGNTVKSNYEYESRFTPLTLPSALENYATALRDPAFYILYKHILNIFVYWQKQMPMYKPEELHHKGIEIEKIQTSKLITYFDPILLNITKNLYSTEHPRDFELFVSYNRLTHDPVNVDIHVKSEKEENVVVKLFLAPKYDSKGLEIPLHVNTENFYLIEQFPYTLNAGENVIERQYVDINYNEFKDGQYKVYSTGLSSFPDNLLLPKGTVGGQTFQLIVYIAENLYVSKRPMAFPSDRPLHKYQIIGVKNIKLQDITIYHHEG